MYSNPSSSYAPQHTGGLNSYGHGHFAARYDSSSPNRHSAAVAVQATEGDLRGWFDAVDTDRSGTIDAHELSAALRRGGLSLSPAGAARVMAMFDDGKGAAVVGGGGMSVGIGGGGGQITFDAFRRLHPFVQHMAKSFKLFDRGGSGRVGPAEVARMLADGGYSLDAPTLQTLLVKFDSERRGSLGFEDFVQLKVFLHNVGAVFGHYDASRSGVVRFTPDSFMEAAVAVR